VSTSRLLYYLREALLTFVQHRRLYTVAVVVMSVAIAILGLFLMLTFNANRFLNTLGAQARVIVFLRDDIQPGQRQAIEDVLSQVAPAQAVRYISKAQAWEDFASWYPKSTQLLEGLGPESLPASLMLKLPADSQSDAALVTLQQRLARLPGIDEVEYGAQWREGFRKLLQVARLGRLIGGGVLGLGMILIMANTTRLALYTHLPDIEIMQLVGATDGFISYPFVLTGMIQGLLSAVVGLGILACVYQTMLGSLSTLIVDTSGLYTLRFLPWSAVLSMIVGSLVVGYLGSALTLHRMLRILRTAS
jgi:cell division transport system permease protein